MNLQQRKSELLAAKAELEARLASTHRHIHGRTEAVSPNFHEQVVETGNDAQVYALDQEGRAELAQINKALERIAHGRYTECARCGQDIGEARLRAIPYTDHCIACA